MLSVRVVYATPRRQEVVWLRCPAGSTVGEAIEASGLFRKYPELDRSEPVVGIHGVKRDLEWVLAHRDRVEIYRPLKLSPTQARRLRARSSR